MVPLSAGKTAIHSHTILVQQGYSPNPTAKLNPEAGAPSQTAKPGPRLAAARAPSTCRASEQPTICPPCTSLLFFRHTLKHHPPALAYADLGGRIAHKIFDTLLLFQFCQIPLGPPIHRQVCFCFLFFFRNWFRHSHIFKCHF